MTSLMQWLDNRTGYRTLLRAALYENIPGGARWRYVWGSTITFALFVQLVTGVVLWAAYSANAQGAWESVDYIQHVMQGGWVLRGIHHYMAHATMILLALHLMQVVIDGAYKAPREVNFWFGLVLLFLVLALSFTGYLLPWDQTGYWATKVGTSIVAIIPIVGPALQKLLIGGVEYGHQTLTRFLALHAGIIPATIALLLVGHIYLFRRHGITVAKPRRTTDGTFWPDQLLRDAVASFAVMAAVLFIVLWTGGARIGAPADPSVPFAAARPEWYFYFFFQWLKYFPASTEVIGAVVLPGLLLLVVASMPFIGRWRLGHRFNTGFVFALFAAITVLTWRGFLEDARDPTFEAARARADMLALRANELARAPDGIPVTGAMTLLREDPLTQGPRLFARHCSSCHAFNGHNGLGGALVDSASAPDLYQFASREWLSGLLDPDRILTDRYFGNTRQARGRMARFVTRGIPQFTATERQQLAKVIKTVSAEAHLRAQADIDIRDSADIAEGKDLIATAAMRCTECHDFHGLNDDPVGPSLTGYGSREWLVGIIANPAHESYYGDRNERMPAFRDEGILDDHAIGLVADWLRGDWYRPAEHSLP